jgi:hypothetical protein
MLLPFYGMSKRLLGFSLFLVGILCASNSLLLVPECWAADNLENLGTSYHSSINPLEQELLTLVNQQRVQQGLQPLTLDNALTAVARNHSQGMAEQGFISHDLPSGSLKTRLIRAGYLYEAARENVASAQTIAKAHVALLNSPPHKKNILATDVTCVGIGIARVPPTQNGQLFITEVFATPREEYQLTTVQTLLLNRVDELRQKGAGSMLSNPVLDEMASRSVQSINLHYKSEELQNLAAASVYKLQQNDRSQLARMDVEVQMIHNPKRLSIPSPAPDGRARIFGSAVRKVTDDNDEPAFLVLALIGITP